jgi:uncharacterized protein (TIGR03083 family)
MRGASKPRTLDPRRSIEPVNHAGHCDHLEVEISRFASAFDVADASLRVPSCPDWSVEELAGHLGFIHRWAEGLVATRAAERISGSEMNLELGPVDAAWFRRGGASLLATLRDADPAAAMWAWGPDQHVSFWSRRQLHETLVHRIDLELALGVASEIEVLVASDAIDEFLVNLASAARFSPRVRELRGKGELVRFTATDYPATWTIELLPEGFSLIETSAPSDAELSGPVTELLTVLYRRRALDVSNLLVTGDRSLVEHWLENSALE